jgi:hypothetical protein
MTTEHRSMGAGEDARLLANVILGSTDYAPHREAAERILAAQPAAGLDVERLATILTARMPDGSYWMNDDGTRFSITHPRNVATMLAHLYETGDVLSGLTPLAALQPASEGEG